MKKAVIDKSKCDNSPTCVAKRYCPYSAIIFVETEGENGKIEIDEERCLGCMRCVKVCQNAAIGMVEVNCPKKSDV